MRTFSLNYFNREGKVELIRLIFAAANVQYKENLVENLTDSGIFLYSWPKKIRLKLAKNYKLIFRHPLGHNSVFGSG